MQPVQIRIRRDLWIYFARCMILDGPKAFPNINSRRYEMLRVFKREKDLKHAKLYEFKHLKAAEYHVTYPDLSEEDKCAVYDERLIGDEEVRKCIVNGEVFRHEIVYMTMQQYRNIFCGGKGNE